MTGRMWKRGCGKNGVIAPRNKTERSIQKTDWTCVELAIDLRR